MKNMTLSKKLLVIAIALSLLTSAGMTFAYFSDYVTAKGEATLSLSGKTDIEEKVTENRKDIAIYNTGDIDMVVRVQVFGPEGMTITGNGWTKAGDWYYYNEALAPGEDSKTSTLTAEISDVPVDPDNDLEIIVVHESEPAVYDAATGKLTPQSEWFK